MGWQLPSANHPHSVVSHTSRKFLDWTSNREHHLYENCDYVISIGPNPSQVIESHYKASEKNQKGVISFKCD